MNLFKLIEFQNNFYCNIFIFYVQYLEKGLADTPQSCTRGVPTIKVKIFGKVHFFQKRLRLPQIKAKILSDRSLRPV